MAEPLSEDAQTSPSVARNRGPILDVLRSVLPDRGTVLEVASGTGEHAVHFAAALPGLLWQPTDADQLALRSIAAHRAAAALANLAPPLLLDASAPDWPVERADAAVSVNMIHIAPWTAACGLMAGASRVLPPRGVLVLYGPFKEHGVHTAPSNAVFDESLRARHPEWGVRDIDEVIALAADHGFAFVERIPMPANNLSLVFHKL